MARVWRTVYTMLHARIGSQLYSQPARSPVSSALQRPYGAVRACTPQGHAPPSLRIRLGWGVGRRMPKTRNGHELADLRIRPVPPTVSSSWRRLSEPRICSQNAPRAVTAKFCLTNGRTLDREFYLAASWFRRAPSSRDLSATKLLPRSGHDGLEDWLGVTRGAEAKPARPVVAPCEASLSPRARHWLETSGRHPEN
ncbi:uncharacterized protein THITE_2132775 [Thermothielavioides terrestris NRRL 8126]|uniref:Uncharacterized protein n=1 Tax=Thermothielavioides terrestris (strain ATCC 38088 / NRRL 8126) TaxID=578455 RepID=G2RHX2_THETT|nr:uncharacterized protein THITE_2132775 [Thermothielavioides terrestris NRRL 8126]AEO71434.1 hypothetical protein THITE_2132775 [Thermothielavioides terrestris NRRL 8126]